MSSFYWKFTRSGRYSTKYISLIIDIHSSEMIRDGAHVFWNTNMKCLEMILLLMMDVEKHNNPTEWHEKLEYKKQIERCNYTPGNYNQPLRQQFELVFGSAVMGRHSGSPLDFGYYKHDGDEFPVDLTNMQFSTYVDGKTGNIGYGRDDKLSCFRVLPEFKTDGIYFDLMPQHNVIPRIFEAMRAKNKKETITFVEEVLHWMKYESS